MSHVTNKPFLNFLGAALLLLLLEAGAGLLLLGSIGSAENGPELPPMSRLADLAGGFEDLEGQGFSFSDLRGKVVLVNLWATWCPPCRAEMPFLQNLWEKFRDDDRVRVLCISTEAPADLSADPLARTLKMPLYSFIGPVPPELEAESLPTTYIFDREGRVVFGHTGMARWDAPEIVAYLEALAEEKTD
jgi:thiol-disulfide isomerase/thioredoxin